MSREIGSGKADENRPPEDPENYERRLVDSLFSDGMSESPHIFVNDYILKLLEISRESISSPESAGMQSVGRPLSRDTLCGIIGRYFEGLGWTCGLDVPSDDSPGGHRFDVVAQKDWYTIIVEVKSEIDVGDFKDILSHIECAGSNFSRLRFFLGMDFSNIRHLLSGDDITDALTEFAVHYQLGIILADHDECWLVPAEFLLINTGF